MSDAPEPETAAPPEPPPREVNRTKGKLAGKKRGPPKGYRKGIPRTATPRTQADAGSPEMEMAPAPPPPTYSEMPRDSGSFQPEYDGPGVRLSREDRDTNQFEIPAAVRRKLTNAGWDWSFKVITIYNQPVDATELMVADKAGWRPAKVKDFPELMPRGTSPDSTVDRHGQRMFIRPAHLTREAQQDDYNFANAQMNNRMAASREGKSLNTGEQGLADMGNIVRPVQIGLEIQGEYGSHGV